MSSEPLCSRRVMLGLGAGAALTCLGVPLYARRVEPAWLRLRQTRVRWPVGPRAPALRLLHLSDLHLSACVPLDLIRRAIRMGLATAPDLVCITGDFITTDLPQRQEYAAALRELSRSVPTYACLGNHDGGRWAGHHGARLQTAEMRAFLASAGVSCLFNDACTVRAGGRELALVGVGDLWAGDTDPARAFAGVAPGTTPCIALCHNPDAKDLLAPYGWDVMLCGHTHGGQLRLPWLGTPFAPVRDPRYVAGLYAWSGRPLYVNAGVGNLHGMRFNCPPEVALLTLDGSA